MNDEQHELPEGWEWKTLPDVAEIIMGQSPPGSTYNIDGNGLPFYQGKIDFGELHPTPRIWCSQPTKIAKPRDILMSVRAPVGPTNIANAECAIGRGLCIIRPRNGMPSRYLREYFQLIADQIADMGKGSTFTSISRADLETIEVPVAPLLEQRRLVEKIERLLSESRAAHQALDKVPALLKRFRQAVLAKAFRGELTERDPNIEPASVLMERIRAERRRKWEEAKGVKSKKYVEPEPPDTSDLPELPERWKWATVEQITENFDGSRVPVKDADRKKRQGPYPYYGASGIIDSIDDYLFNGVYLLIGEDGANLLSRSTPIAFQANGKFWVNNHAHVLRTHGGIPLRYVEHYFNKIDLSPYVTGTAQPKLTQKNMNSITIPLAPLAEQRRIVAKIESLFAQAEAIERAVEIARRRAAKVDQAVLARAFRGEL